MLLPGAGGAAVAFLPVPAGGVGGGWVQRARSNLQAAACWRAGQGVEPHPLAYLDAACGADLEQGRAGQGQRQAPSAGAAAQRDEAG